MRAMNVLLVVSCIVTCSNSLLAFQGDPIKELTGITPNESVLEAVNESRALVIRSEATTKKYFDENNCESLLENVDFENQVVVVFAWRGSGGDRIRFEVAESYPEQISFSIDPGRTRDLRTHMKVYVLRANVSCRVDGRGLDLEESSEEYVRVEMRGRLNSQVMAIGGETTGFVLTAGEINWELSFNDDELAAQARELHEKTVIVSGTLTVRQGVEIAKRWIVEVKELESD